MVEACGAGRIKIASFRDTTGVILGLKNSASFADDTARRPQGVHTNLEQNTEKSLMGGVFLPAGRSHVAAGIRRASS
jgi:hypothetical protein